MNKNVKKVTIVSPEVYLILKDNQSKFHYYIQFINNLTQCYPDDLLSEDEKKELDSLISISIQNIKKKFPGDIQYVSESENKQDDLLKMRTNEEELLDLFGNKNRFKIVNSEQFSQFNEIDSLLFIEFNKQGLTTVNGLTDKELIEFSGNVFRYSNIRKKDVNNNLIHFLNSNKKDAIPFKTTIQNTNFYYVPAEYTKFHNLNKNDYQEICEKMNVDAVLKINYHFLLNAQKPWNPFDSGYLYSISLIGEVELINRKGISIFYKTIEGRSEKLKVLPKDMPVLQNSFVISKQNDQVIITKSFGTGSYNFTFDNIFKDLFIDSITKYMLELNKTSF